MGCRTGTWILWPLLGAAVFGQTPPAGSPPAFPPDVLKDLVSIHHEVRTMGFYPGENFVFQEFATGNDDDDDTNKDFYVGVLIRPRRDGDRMEIRVTRMVRDPRNRRVAEAAESRSITCRISGDAAEVMDSDYGPKEAGSAVRDLLKAVLQKKAILKFPAIAD